MICFAGIYTHSNACNDKDIRRQVLCVDSDCHGLALTVWSLYRSSPHWGGEKNGKKKAKLVGRDKGSLTEQQTKLIETTILIERIYKTNSGMHRAALTD